MYTTTNPKYREDLGLAENVLFTHDYDIHPIILMASPYTTKLVQDMQRLSEQILEVEASFASGSLDDHELAILAETLTQATDHWVSSQKSIWSDERCYRNSRRWSDILMSH